MLSVASKTNILSAPASIVIDVPSAALLTIDVADEAFILFIAVVPLLLKVVIAAALFVLKSDTAVVNDVMFVATLSFWSCIC